VEKLHFIDCGNISLIFRHEQGGGLGFARVQEMNEPGRTMKPHFSVRRIGPYVSFVNGRTARAGGMIDRIIPF
jgi:hypothetical protein